MKKFHRIAGVLIATLVRVFLPDGKVDSGETVPNVVSNPARAYCSGVMGYEYEVVYQADGSQDGVCHMPNGTSCSQWDFYSGKCGAEYSWCNQKGYDTVTRRDGRDPFSREYAVCIDGKRSTEIGLISSGLTWKPRGLKWLVIWSPPGERRAAAPIPRFEPPGTHQLRLAQLHRSELDHTGQEPGLLWQLLGVCGGWPVRGAT